MYNAHYQFRESPFGTTPDPQFYYSNAVYREAWAILRYGIEGRKGFIVITGDAGTGKTTLLRKALHEFPSNIKAAYIPSTALVGFNDLLRLILKDLGLLSSTDDKFAMMERLKQYLLERFDGGDAVALLIDEAQDLSLSCLEELRLLGNLETDKHKLLQIVLVGQPGLEQKLNQSELLQLRQRVVLRCRLRPIEPREVGLYIEARLQTVGRRRLDLFEPAAIERIAFYSKGFPRLINIICDNALLYAFAESRLKVSADMIEGVACDLLIAEPLVDAEVRARTLTRPIAEKASFHPAHSNEDERTARKELLPAEFADNTRRDFMPLRRGSRYSRTIIGALIAIVLAGGLFYYLQRSRTPDFNVANDTPALAAGGLGPTDQADPSAVSLRPAPPAPRLETSSVSHQQVAAARLDGTTEVSTELAEQRKPNTPIAPERSTPPPARGRQYAALTGNFFVAGASFVRSKPSSGAEIIATLEPGTRINIAGRTGAYYRVRSLGRETIHGYVHEEDAFFERN